MTRKKRKIVHAIGVAVIGALTDIATQLSSPSISVTRALAVGLVIGVLARVGGAWLAATALDEDPPTNG